MEKEILGQVFRELREQKNFSLAKAAGDEKGASVFVTSRQQLSRFERGESDITLTKIFDLLENIGVSFEEYLYHVRGYQLPTGWDFFYKADILYEYGKYDELADLYQKIQASYAVSKKQSEYWRSLRIKAMLVRNHVQGWQFTEEELAQVRDYLFSVLEWGEEEIFLFGDLVEPVPGDSDLSEFLPDDLIETFTKEIIARKEFYAEVKDNRNLVIWCVRDVAYHFIAKKDQARATYFMNQYWEIIKDPLPDVYVHKEYKMIESLYQLMIGKIEEGKKNLEELAAVYEYLYFKDTADAVRKAIPEFVAQFVTDK